MSSKGKMAYDIFEIVPSFRIEGNSAATVSYCSGHIDVVFHFKNGDPAQSGYPVPRIKPYIKQ